MSYKPWAPFNALPALPPKCELETTDVLKRLTAAARAVGELKGMGRVIPNQAMLINTVVLQEAKASSELENVITTNDKLYKALTANTSNVDAATKEVLRYREAVWQGYRGLMAGQRMDANFFERLARTITSEDNRIRNRPGTNLKSDTTGEVIYTPPEGERHIRRMLRDLETFIYDRERFDPLLSMALVHYQFEAIHPFFDGNGRTGRIINSLFPVLHGLLDLPVLYLSRYIIDQKKDYYKRLRLVTEESEWTEWIVFMLEGVAQTAIATRQRIADIRQLLDETLETAARELPATTYSQELIELIFCQPYTKGQSLVDAGIAKRQTAAEYLKQLERIGVLESTKVGRENLYLNRKLYDLLGK